MRRSSYFSWAPRGFNFRSLMQSYIFLVSFEARNIEIRCAQISGSGSVVLQRALQSRENESETDRQSFVRGGNTNITLANQYNASIILAVLSFNLGKIFPKARVFPNALSFPSTKKIENSESK